MSTLTEELHALALLMEADPKRDSAMRSLALEFHKKLYAKLRDEGYVASLREPSSYRGALEVPGSDIDPRYHELRIFLLPKSWAHSEVPDAVAGGAFTQPREGKPKRYLPIIELPWLNDAGDPKGVARRAHMSRLEFLHEFIHYLDNRRGGGFIRKQKRQRDFDPNEPADFNAYYQQAAYELDQKAKAIVSSKFRPSEFKRRDLEKYLKPNDLQGFMKLAKDTLDPDYFKGLTPKNRKKVLSRLARLHGFLIDTYLKPLR